MPRVKVQDIPYSLKFNGTNTYVETSVVPNINSFSFVTRIYWHPNALVGSRTIFHCQDASGGIYIKHQNPSSRKLGVDTYNIGSATGLVSPNELSIGWHTIGVTRDATTTYMYVDGVLVNSAVCTMTAAASSVSRIGYSLASVQCWLGNMSGIILSNTATFTAAEMLAYHKSGIIPSGATAIYKLDEGAGTTAYDTSGNGNNGTITNGTFTSDVPTKKRGVVGGNLVYNGDFEYAPVGGVPTTSGFNWIDGTAGGSSTNGIFGWQVINRLGTTSIYFDNTVSKSGSNSLKISLLAAGSWGGIGNTSAVKNSRGIGSGQPSIFTVLPNTSYTISLYMKTQHHSGTSDTGAICQVINYTAGGSSVGSALNVMNGVLSTTDWTKYSLTFTTPSTASFLQILPRIIGSNGAATLIMDAWFDDIQLYPTTNTTRTAV